MTESRLIQKFYLSNPGNFQVMTLIILRTIRCVHESAIMCSWSFFCLIQVALSLWPQLHLFYTRNVLFIALYVVLEHKVSGCLSDDKIFWRIHWRAYFASTDYLFLYIFLIIGFWPGVSFSCFVPVLQCSRSLYTPWIRFWPSGTPGLWGLLSWVHLGWLTLSCNILWSNVSSFFTPIHF